MLMAEGARALTVERKSVSSFAAQRFSVLGEK